MTKTHIKLVSEADIKRLEDDSFLFDRGMKAVHFGHIRDWFNSLASAPEVGEAGKDKIERNYVYEDGIEPGYDKEPAVILALRNTELQKRVEQLEDLLSSAYNIANRNGEDTHWLRFAAQLHVHGISPITAKTFKILPSDENYQPDRTAQLEAELARYKQHYTNAVKGRMDFRNSFRAERARNAQLEADNKRLVEALLYTTSRLIYTDNTQLIANNKKLLAEMEAKG